MPRRGENEEREWVGWNAMVGRGCACRALGAVHAARGVLVRHGHTAAPPGAAVFLTPANLSITGHTLGDDDLTANGRRAQPCGPGISSLL